MLSAHVPHLHPPNPPGLLAPSASGWGEVCLVPLPKGGQWHLRVPVSGCIHGLEARFARKLLLSSSRSKDPVAAAPPREPLTQAPRLPGHRRPSHEYGWCFLCDQPLSLRSGSAAERPAPRDASSFVERQDTGRRQMDARLQTSAARAAHKGGPDVSPVMRSPRARSKSRSPRPAFYQSDALSTLSTWTSGCTFKKFLSAEIFNGVAGVPPEARASWHTRLRPPRRGEAADAPRPWLRRTLSPGGVPAGALSPGWEVRGHCPGPGGQIAVALPLP